MKKIAVVIFLTLLIWVWAYLALERDFEHSATLYISPTTSPDLLVRFDRQTPVSLDLRLKGSAAKVAELQSKLNADETDPDKERLDFYYNVETVKQDKLGRHILNVLSFLNRSTKMRDLGITVESCKIDGVEVGTIYVTVEKLEEKWLTIQCIDEKNGTILQHETIEPPRVMMFVRQDSELQAKVALTKQQIEQARKYPIMGKPYIELTPNKQTFAPIRVQIKLLPVEMSLRDRPLPTTIGYVFSKNLIGKYDVELLNENELVSRTMFRATDKAWAVYKDTFYQAFIEIRDGDEAADEVTREVIYNFPAEFVEKGQIRLNEPRRQARFKLVPVAASPVQP
ncbi:MAG: hypothetical protein ACYTFK_06165 [Planctomycetota bacterium]